MTQPAYVRGADQRRDDVRAAIWMLASGFAYTVTTAVMKHLSTELPETVVVFYRHLFATLWYLPMVLRSHGDLVMTRRLPAHLMRAACGFGSFFGFVWAMNRMSLADATALAFTAPLWAILLAVVVMREPVRPTRWLATAIGFGGVLLIVKPDGALGWPVVLGLGSAMVSSLSMMLVKKLSATEPPDRIAFYFMFFGMIFSVPGAIASWEWPDAHYYLWFAGLGLLAVFSQGGLTRAYALGQFTKVAPMDFCRLPTTILLGWLVFGDLPDWLGVLGMALIGGASMYILLAGRKPAAVPGR